MNSLRGAKPGVAVVRFYRQPLRDFALECKASALPFQANLQVCYFPCKAKALPYVIFTLSTTYCLLITGFINRQRADFVGYLFDGFAGDVDYGPGRILLEDPVAII